jgi:hypothetical protein
MEFFSGGRPVPLVPWLAHAFVLSGDAARSGVAVSCSTTSSGWRQGNFLLTLRILFFHFLFAMAVKREFPIARIVDAGWMYCTLLDVNHIVQH